VIADASDAERRGIERRLHDGVQQHLVALAVNVQLVRQAIETDLPAAHALLDEMGDDVREALDGIRELAGEIYPPLLLDRGLAEALSATAAAVTIPTQVVADGLQRYPSTVEATVHFCCREALRSAAGERATVRVWADDDALHFEVSDDGAADGRDEATLRAASDRTEALGGALEVSRGLGGRRVAGTIPVQR
jgi:signal transduction histidine kinase